MVVDDSADFRSIVHRCLQKLRERHLAILAMNDLGGTVQIEMDMVRNYHAFSSHTTDSIDIY